MTRLSLLLLAMQTAVVPLAWTTETCRFDFEDGSTAGFLLDGASLTRSAAEVVDGSCSVAADTRGSTEEWHEFLNTGPDVRFEPGKTYRVSFDYRVIDEGPEGTWHARPQFYSLLRSRSAGPSDKYDRYGPFWRLGTGMSGRVDCLAKTGDCDDHYLIIGIRREAALAVDNIEIAVTAGHAPGDGDPIRVMPYGPDPVLAALEAERDQAGTIPLMKGMLNVICNEMGALSDEERAAVVDELRLDFVDWVPLSHRRQHSTGLEYGARTAASEIEYQEHYKVEEPEIWPNRFRELWGSGLAVSLCGTPIQDERFAEGGWYTCHNGERWNQRYRQSLEWTAGFYEGLCQDNIACAPFNKGGGCFCSDCERLFQDYLEERYPRVELERWGITRLKEFSIRRRMVETGRLGEAALADPLVREYIKFQNITHRDRWREHVVSAKKSARKQGVEFFPVMGNQIGMQGFWPFAPMLSPYNDAIEIEHVGTTEEMLAEEGALYRLSLASGYGRKPVWARGVFLDPETKRPTESAAFWRYMLGEALACGARHTYHLLRKDQRQFTMIGGSGEAYRVDYREKKNLYRVFMEFAEFCDENRALLEPRESLAMVAVVYSIPSAMWRQFTPLGLFGEEPKEKLREACAKLNRLHVPHDVVIFGHPELRDDRDTLNRLYEYDALVLPLADCMSDAQIAALDRFIRMGGTIVAASDTARYDENRNERKGWTRPRGWSPAEDPATWRFVQEDYRNRALSTFTMDAPETLFAHPWLSCGGHVLSIHFSNHDVDVAGDMVEPATMARLWIGDPKLPSDGTAVWLVPGEAPRPLPAPTVGYFGIDEVESVHLEFTGLPPVDSYAVLVYGDLDMLAERNKEAKQARTEDRAAVMEWSRRRFGGD